MPSPQILIAPRSIEPVVLSCEHASNRLPIHGKPSVAERERLRSHWGWDIGAWPLTRALARRLQTSAIGGRWSRLFIDLNRGADDPTLVRESVEGLSLSWNRDLDHREIERRWVEWHMPYHQQLERLMVRRQLQGVTPLVFAVHSFTPVFNGRRRNFDIGVLFDEHGGPARSLGRDLRDAGLSVRYNRPYSGMAGMMYSAERHGRHHGVVCLELEVNQRMFEDEGVIERLADALEPALCKLAR